MLDIGTLTSLPFGVADLLTSAFALTSVFGPYLLLGIALSFAPQLIALFQKALGIDPAQQRKEEKAKKLHDMIAKAHKEQEKEEKKAQKSERVKERKRRKYAHYSREEVYAYARKVKHYENLARYSDPRKAIEYQALARKVRAKAETRYGIII